MFALSEGHNPSNIQCGSNSYERRADIHETFLSLAGC
jgi:hypothetical protein